MVKSFQAAFNLVTAAVINIMVVPNVTNEAIALPIPGKANILRIPSKILAMPLNIGVTTGAIAVVKVVLKFSSADVIWSIPPAIVSILCSTIDLA